MGVNKHRKPKFSRYVMLGRDMILYCKEWKQLSPCAKVAYICIKAKHNGSNNGSICLHYSEMATVRGFGSPSTVAKAFTELEVKGWIRRTHLGGLHRYRNVYGLTGRFDGYIADRPVTLPEDFKTSTVSVMSKQAKLPPKPMNGKGSPGEAATPVSSQPPVSVDSLYKNCS